MGEDIIMSEEEIQSACSMVLQLVKMSGGHKNLRLGFEKFMEMLGQEFAI